MRRFAERSKQPLENMATPDTGQETKVKMVWPCLTVFWFSKDNPTGHSERKKKKKEDRRRGGKTISKNGQEWTLPAQLGQLKTGQVGKGLLRIHLWCPDDLPRLWDRIEYCRCTDMSAAWSKQIIYCSNSSFIIKHR